MSKTNRIGELRPRYLFAINPYKDARFSKCPRCQKLTAIRKFPLLVLLKAMDPFILGKDCRYCSRCEFIIAHKDELDAVIEKTVKILAPSIKALDYLIAGTVDRATWKRGLERPTPIQEVLAHTAPIKKYLDLIYEPAHWVKVDSDLPG